MARGPEGLRGAVGRQHHREGAVNVTAAEPGLEVERAVLDLDLVLERERKLMTMYGYCFKKEGDGLKSGTPQQGAWLFSSEV